MRLLEAWTELTLLDLARLLVPVFAIVTAIFVPWRRTARIAAIVVAAFLLVLPEVSSNGALSIGWSLLWAVVAWNVGVASKTDRPRPVGLFGGFESGTVGLALGTVLLVLLIAAIGRQSLPPEEGRRASYGLMFLCLGFLHLMLRRDSARAGVAFASLGLGIQVLAAVAAGALIAVDAPRQGAILVATAITVVLAARIANTRRRVAGSTWVSDAHDLHD